MSVGDLFPDMESDHSYTGEDAQARSLSSANAWSFLGQDAAAASSFLGCLCAPALFYNTEGVVFCANKAFAALLGQPEGLFRGSNVRDWLKLMSGGRLEGEWPDGSGGMAVAQEVSVALRGERTRTLRLFLLPFLASDGSPGGIAAFLVDLPRDGAVQGAFPHQNALLATLMEHLPDPVYVKDQQHRYTAANAATLSFLGLDSMDQLLGKTDSDLFPEPLARQYIALEKEVLASGRAALNILEKMTDGVGNMRWILVSKAPLLDANGEATGVLGINRDITERRATELALAATQEQFRQILEYSRDIAYKVDVRTGRYEYISPSVEAVLGISPETAMRLGPSCVFDNVHPEDRDCYSSHDRLIAENLRLGLPSPVIEYRIRNAEGVYRWLADSASHLYDADGALVSVVGMVRDITEQKQAETAARDASRMEVAATLAGGVAHEINNLMASALANAELLVLRHEEDGASLDMLNAIAKAAEEAGGLAKQLLAYARGGKYQPIVVELNKAIEGLVALEADALSPAVHLVLDLESGLKPILADPTQMRQLISNLLANASEALREGGEVAICTRNVELDADFAAKHPGVRPGAYVCLTVRDNGEGMTSEAMKRMFEPFFTTRGRGRGLGLAAVYGIVRTHDGCITAASEVGRGTEFTIHLPAAQAAPRPASCPAPAAPPMGHEHILVVDDEETVLNATSMVLERLGYRTIKARGGREAAALAADGAIPIDLVVLDMVMPDMDGAAVFEALRKLRPRLKVILCSGFEIDKAAQRTLDNGAMDFVRKPFRMQTMAVAVRTALDGPRPL